MSMSTNNKGAHAMNDIFNAIETDFAAFISAAEDAFPGFKAENDAERAKADVIVDDYMESLRRRSIA